MIKGGPGPPVGALVASFAVPMAAPPSGMRRGVIGHHAGIVRCLRGTGDAAAHSTRHVRLQCRGNRRNAARCLRSWFWVRAQFPQPPGIPIAACRLAGPKLAFPYIGMRCLVPPRAYHATAFTAISSEFVRAHKSTLSTYGHCVASRPVSALSCVAGVVPNHCACLGSSVCYPTTI